MNNAAIAVLLLSVALLLAACADDPTSFAVPIDVCRAQRTTYCVDANTGNDANPGTRAAPFKTISRALSVAVSGERVGVRPGTYDVANGEVFPLLLPAGVGLFGDEPGKGGGPRATVVIGDGNVAPLSPIEAVLDAGADSVVAGFSLTNTGTTTFDMTLTLHNPRVTVRNNRVVNGGRNGIDVRNGADNHVIVGNVISGHVNALGLGFIAGGVGSRVEANVIVDNERGVEYDAPGGDLGRGAAGSAGGNVISCNTRNDLWTNTGVTINARDNLWDHAPPTLETTQTFTGVDIFNGSGATIDAGGAAVVAAPCP